MPLSWEVCQSPAKHTQTTCSIEPNIYSYVIILHIYVVHKKGSKNILPVWTTSSSMHKNMKIIKGKYASESGIRNTKPLGICRFASQSTPGWRSPWPHTQCAPQRRGKECYIIPLHFTILQHMLYSWKFLPQVVNSFIFLYNGLYSLSYLIVILIWRSYHIMLHHTIENAI